MRQPSLEDVSRGLSERRLRAARSVLSALAARGSVRVRESLRQPSCASPDKGFSHLCPSLAPGMATRRWVRRLRRNAPVRGPWYAEVLAGGALAYRDCG